MTPFVSAPGGTLLAPAGYEPVSGPYWTLYLGYLGYIDMDTDEGQRQILDAATEIPPEYRTTCMTSMRANMSDPARKALEDKMLDVKYHDEFFDRIYDEAKAEAMAKAMATARIEAKAEAMANAKAEALADGLVVVLQARFTDTTADHIALAGACTDLDQLHAWLVAAATAASANDVFGPR